MTLAMSPTCPGSSATFEVGGASAEVWGEIDYFLIGMVEFQTHTYMYNIF